MRSVSLPGVADKDISGALDLQVDTLHPWGDVEVAWGWSRLRRGALRHDVIVGLARNEVLGSYETLFAEAGIPIAAATFSAAAIHASLRIWSAEPDSLLCFNTEQKAAAPRNIRRKRSAFRFSAEFFGGSRNRAIALARAELRMPPDYPATPLPDVLPGGPVVDSPLAYSAAVAGSAPRAASFANLLPAERRASHKRMQYVLPAILGILLAIALPIVFVVLPAMEQKRYRGELDRAARQLRPSRIARANARTPDRRDSQQNSAAG